MSFVPKKVYLRKILLHYFIQKKYVTEAHITFAETYGDHALLETKCKDWFRCFKTNDFDVEDKERSGDKELEAWLHENSCQAQAEQTKSLGAA